MSIVAPSPETFNNITKLLVEWLVMGIVKTNNILSDP